MNSIPLRQVLFKVRSQVRTLAVLGILTLAPGLLAADATTPAVRNTDRVLFLGLDVLVDQPGFVGEIQGVSRGAVSVGTTVEARSISLRTIKSFKTEFAPKVSVAGITLSNVHAERAYSPGNDPALQAVAQQSRMMAVMSELQNRQESVDYATSRATSAATTGGQDPASQAAAASSQASMQILQRMSTEGQGMLNMDPSRVADIRSAEGGSFDAFEVTFEISSVEPVDDAYAIMLTTVKTREAPKQPQRVLAFEKLPQISSKPRKVTITQRGLPPGFGYSNYQIHVYSHGREFATNLASQRVNVSRIEAFQYLFYQHLAGNFGKSMPPVLVTTLLDAEPLANVPSVQRKRSVQVKVGADGIVTEVILGPSATPQTNDAALEKIIRDAYYFPALDKGKPVEGSLKLAVGDFVR